ncbi:MAG TPA: hypothetical protein VIE66_16330 [Methylocella sp.]|jgi:hypothetical protein
MGILIVGAALFGMILGQFFKWYVILPACWLAIVLVFVFPAHTEPNLLRWFLQIYIVTTGLQIGYAVGLFARDFMPCRMMVVAA